MKLTKYRCQVLTIKDVLDDKTCTLTYFHKDIVTSCKEIKKDCDKEKEKKILIKMMVIIEKGCDN